MPEAWCSASLTGSWSSFHSEVQLSGGRVDDELGVEPGPSAEPAAATPVPPGRALPRRTLLPGAQRLLPALLLFWRHQRVPEQPALPRPDRSWSGGRAARMRNLKGKAKLREVKRLAHSHTGKRGQSDVFPRLCAPRALAQLPARLCAASPLCLLQPPLLRLHLPPRPQPRAPPAHRLAPWPPQGSARISPARPPSPTRCGKQHASDTYAHTRRHAGRHPCTCTHACTAADLRPWPCPVPPQGSYSHQTRYTSGGCLTGTSVP